MHRLIRPCSPLWFEISRIKENGRYDFVLDFLRNRVRSFVETYHTCDNNVRLRKLLDSMLDPIEAHTYRLEIMLLGFFAQKVDLVLGGVKLQQSMVDAFSKIQCTECWRFTWRKRTGHISLSFINNDTPLRLRVTGGHVLFWRWAHRAVSTDGEGCNDILDTILMIILDDSKA